MKFSRCFAMPNAATFGIKPIGEFVRRYMAGGGHNDTICIAERKR